MIKQANSSVDVSEFITTSLDVFTAVLDIAGVVGNTASFIALLKCVGLASMHVILRSLAVADTIFLLSHLIFQLAHPYQIITVNKLLKSIGHTYVNQAAITITVWTTVLLSIERLVAICFPFKHRDVFSKRRTVLYIIATWIISFLLRIPGFLPRLFQTLKIDTSWPTQMPFRLNYTNVTIGGRSLMRFQETNFDLAMRKTHLVIWSSEAIISIIVVIVCNAMILREIFKQDQEWSAIHTKRQSETSATKVPFWVIAMFLLSEVPKKICFVLLYTGSATKYSFALITFCDVCTVLNSSTNIVIYFACSAHYRRKISGFLSLSRKADVDTTLL